MKKILALLLAVVMVVSLFAGCGGQTATETTPAAGNETPAAGNETPAAPAEGEIPTLVWYMVGNGMPSNYESWKAQINAYLEEKIGVHVDIQCISWGDWDSVSSVMIQTNGDYDLMFTTSGYSYSSINMGAFADLDAKAQFLHIGDRLIHSACLAHRAGRADQADGIAKLELFSAEHTSTPFTSSLSGIAIVAFGSSAILAFSLL